MFVQKVVLQPGEWEGIHSHSGNRLGINLTDGQSTVSYGDEETTLIGRAGSAGWQRAVNLSERHESGNTGMLDTMRSVEAGKKRLAGNIVRQALPRVSSVEGL